MSWWELVGSPVGHLGLNFSLGFSSAHLFSLLVLYCGCENLLFFFFAVGSSFLPAAGVSSSPFLLPSESFPRVFESGTWSDLVLPPLPFDPWS